MAETLAFHCSLLTHFLTAALYCYRVSVSVVSFEGADCKLVHLGLVADMTGGVVDIVSLNNLDEQFGNILKIGRASCRERV